MPGADGQTASTPVRCAAVRLPVVLVKVDVEQLLLGPRERAAVHGRRGRSEIALRGLGLGCAVAALANEGACWGDGERCGDQGARAVCAAAHGDRRCAAADCGDGARAGIPPARPPRRGGRAAGRGRVGGVEGARRPDPAHRGIVRGLHRTFSCGGGQT